MSVAIKKTVLTCKALTEKWQKLAVQFQSVMLYKYIERYNYKTFTVILLYVLFEVIDRSSVLIHTHCDP